MLTRATATNEGFDTDRGDRGREISRANVVLELVMWGRRGELSRYPIDDEGQMWADREGSSLGTKASRRRGGELAGTFVAVFVLEELVREICRPRESRVTPSRAQPQALCASRFILG